MKDKKRLFIGIPLLSDVVEEVCNIKKGYPGLKGIRWTKKENLHITLVFIGDVEVEKIEEIKRSIKKVTDSYIGFKLDFNSLKIIKKQRTPLMFWAEYRSNKNFDQLHSELFDALRKVVSLKKEHKKNIPHITMARLKVDRNIVVPPFSEDIIFPDIPVDNIVLWESTLLAEGPAYDPVQNFKLQ